MGTVCGAWGLPTFGMTRIRRVATTTALSPSSEIVGSPICSWYVLYGLKLCLSWLSESTAPRLATAAASSFSYAAC